MTQPLLPSEGFSDSDEVFPKEMTKWNSNDFIDAFASPMEAEGAPGKDRSACNEEREREFDELGLSADGAGEFGYPRMPEARGQGCEDIGTWENMIFQAFR